VNFLVPLEVWRDGQLYAQSGSGDGLDVDSQLQFWELMDVFVYEFTYE